MLISEIICEEILSSSIATVSFPLFGKKDAIRRAVDPYGYTKSKKKVKNPSYPTKVKDIYSGQK